MADRSDYDKIISAMELCCSAGYIIPCVALAYTLIDSLAWLLYGDMGLGSGKRFTMWVEQYLLPELPCECSALDLYAARCAILHTLSSESHLNRAGRAKAFVYSTGLSSSKIEEAASVLFPNDKTIGLDVNAFVAALRIAAAKFEKQVQSDAEMRRAVGTRFQKKYAFVTEAQLLGLARALRGRRTEDGKGREGDSGTPT